MAPVQYTLTASTAIPPRSSVKPDAITVAAPPPRGAFMTFADAVQ